jgi:methionine sulfoxide reductase heme-binding subunit
MAGIRPTGRVAQAAHDVAPDHTRSRFAEFVGRLLGTAAVAVLRAGMANSIAVWRDRRGRVSGWRVAALIFLAAPLVIAIHAVATVGLGARPVNDLIHRTGYWALVFLLVTLAITPLVRVGRFGGLIDVRRMFGVGAFVYAATHILLFVGDQMFDLLKVATEIALRLYLTIGFVALLGLGALAATSTDAMVKRLGSQRWQRLHQLVYGIALLALIHFFQQTKADVWVPTFVAGLFVWLMSYRLLTRWRRGVPTALTLTALAVTVSVLVFAGEAIGIGLYYKVSPLLVLQSVFEFDLAMIRPGWLVLGAGLCVVLIQLVRSWRQQTVRGARPPPVARATQIEDAA